MNHRLIVGMLTIMTSTIIIGCKPKTVSQKIEDKAEDAGHEINQGVERAGEKIKEATK